MHREFYTSKLGDLPPISELPPLRPLPIRRESELRQREWLKDNTLPEGYEMLYDKAGAPFAPLDRWGKLRKVGDEWWEPTWIDGETVYVKAFWRGKLGHNFSKPDFFEGRKLCSAWHNKRPARGWCDIPKGECQRHCGEWSFKWGCACGNYPMKGQIVCGPHSQKHKNAIDSRKVDDALKSIGVANPGGYWEVLNSAKKKIAKKLNTKEISLLPEVEVQRIRCAELLAGTEPPSAILSKLLRAWENFAKAPSEDETKKALAEVGKLIYSGGTVIQAEREISKTQELIGQLVSKQAKMDFDKSQTVTGKELQAFIAGMISVVVGLHPLYLTGEGLALFRTQVKGLIASSASPPGEDEYETGNN